MSAFEEDSGDLFSKYSQIATEEAGGCYFLYYGVMDHFALFWMCTTFRKCIRAQTPVWDVKWYPVAMGLKIILHPGETGVIITRRGHAQSDRTPIMSRRWNFLCESHVLWCVSSMESGIKLGKFQHLSRRHPFYVVTIS